MPHRLKGRAALSNPPNRFEPLHVEFDEADDADAAASPRTCPTVLLRDASRSILSRNDSPDVPFTYSINPYRGCEHGCIYCYARPTHEYLGFSPGLDFESRILVKESAPQLLRAEFRKRSWQPQVVCISGNTDCYQAVERKLELTRDCLRVFLECRNPVGIITKSALVLRDLDVLSELARLRLVAVTVSVTTLRSDLASTMEPRASAPARRLQAIEELAAAGVPVGVNVAPVIPGLTDAEIPAILKAAAARGASYAGYLLLRLPGAVEPLFLEWLDGAYPNRAAKVKSRLREVHGGELTDPRFGKRMRGEGPLAELIATLFRQTCARLDLDRRYPDLATDLFRTRAGIQKTLFPAGR